MNLFFYIKLRNQKRGNNMENNEILKNCYTKHVEAYLGGNGYEGSNSNSGLYGADLTAKMREITKACKIKGVTYSIRHCDSLTVKVKISDEDIVAYEDIASKIENSNFLNICRGGWREDPKQPGRYIDVSKYWEMTAAEQNNAIKFWAQSWYKSAINGDFGSICHGWQLKKENYPCFSEKFWDRWNALTKIVSSFNYDKSNSMVDYFETGFYEHWEIIKK